MRSTQFAQSKSKSQTALADQASMAINNGLLREQAQQHAPDFEQIMRELAIGLAKANAYNRGLLEASVDALISIGPDNKITDANRAAENITGHARAKLIGTDFADCFTEPNRAKALYQQVFSAGIVRDYELAIRHANGHVTPVFYNAAACRDEAGDVICVFATARDITERKTAESALTALRKKMEDLSRLATVVRDSNDAIIMHAFDGNILAWNQGAKEVYGYTEAEALGMNVREIVAEADREAALTLIEKIQQGEVVKSFELRRVTKDGRILNIWMTTTLLTNEEGTPVAIATTERDMTERKRLEQRVLDRTVELEAANKELEAFSYSVSHDLRSPLRAIDGFSQALLEDYAGKLDAEGQGYLNRVRAGTQRMGQLIDDILRLSMVTRSELRREKVNLTAMAQAIALGLQHQEPQRQVEFVIAPGLTALADGHLVQVILDNLLGNAWKFTAKHGSARIEVGSITNEECKMKNAEQTSPEPLAASAAHLLHPTSSTHHPILNDDQVVFFVRDDGAGFDMVHASKLFGAFQRLHSQTEFGGTGIGLAMVRRIVNRQGGNVWAESAVEQGTTIYLTLPRAAGAD